MTHPFPENGSMKKEMSEAGQQLALVLPLPQMTARNRRPIRPCSRARAQWWFDQMRRVVDEGADFPLPNRR